MLAARTLSQLCHAVRKRLTSAPAQEEAVLSRVELELVDDPPVHDDLDLPRAATAVADLSRPGGVEARDSLLVGLELRHNSGNTRLPRSGTSTGRDKRRSSHNLPRRRGGAARAAHGQEMAYTEEKHTWTAGHTALRPRQTRRSRPCGGEERSVHSATSSAWRLR